MKKPMAIWGRGLSAALGLAVAFLTGCRSSHPEPAVFADIPPAAESSPIAFRSPSQEASFRVGDLLTVTFSGTVEPAPPAHEDRIKEDGTITLPLIGAVVATNRTPDELSREIYHRYVPKFYPYLVVRPPWSDRFYYVGGEVRRPNRQTWLGEITVSQAIEAAGGFTDRARRTRVQLVRADGTKIAVDCQKLLKHPVSDPKVLPGDSIIIPRRWW